jgi:thioredoxin-like negative regulator of GroEL
MSTTLTPAQVFQQLLGLIENNVFQNALPIITAALTQIEQNPQTVLNPLQSGLFAAKFVADLSAVLPSIENTGVQDAASVVQAFLTGVITKLNTNPATAAQVGAALANTATGG